MTIKKILILGALIVILVGLHYSLTDCHTSAGGFTGVCESSFEKNIAIFEYNIILFVQILTLDWLLLIPLGFIVSSFGVEPYSFCIFISFIFVFAIIALIIGFLAQKIKQIKTNISKLIRD